MPRAIVGIVAAVLLGAIALFAGGGVIAESTEREDRGVLRSELRDGIIKLDADGADIKDVIEELSRTLGFEVLGDVPNNGLRMKKRLEGTLGELLAALLRDASYVLVTEAGAPKRLTILPAGPASSPRFTVVQPLQPYGSMSTEQLRKKEDELVVLAARYEDMSEEAREHANPELAKKLKSYAEKLAGDAESIRARLATKAPKKQ